MDKMNYGLIGIGVMGQNLTLNIAKNGFSVVVYDRATEKISEFLQGKAKGKNISGALTIEEFVKQLEIPRKIILLVNAGKPVDDVVDLLRPYLGKGDIIIDGGNSFFMDTERRTVRLEKSGIYFVGSGVSGGEEGALRGPSIMPGGALEAYYLIEPMVTKIAAHINNEPCCTYIGPRGAGHYVKMVHNGIEYAIMQLICETYDILTKVLGLSALEIGKIFNEWNTTDKLNSYLFEITGKVLAKADPDTGNSLVNMILDTAEQKGTGKWTSQNGFDLGVPIPTINAAVEARMLSSIKDQRESASRILKGPIGKTLNEKKDILNEINNALYASIIISYAQGMALLQTASREYEYNLKLDKIASIWRGGCIIRAKILDPIMHAFEKSPKLNNIMVDQYFAQKLNELETPFRNMITVSLKYGVPVLAMSSALAYYDAYRSERLPANLLQAQRDYFGAHTYRRIDKEGIFHTKWED